MPLRLNRVPVRGPTGAPDNLIGLEIALGSVLPPGIVGHLNIEHDDGCPCVEHGRGSVACTCELVNVVLTAESE
jgi:hypothetical protein